MFMMKLLWTLEVTNCCLWVLTLERRDVTVNRQQTKTVRKTVRGANLSIHLPANESGLTWFLFGA